MKTHLSALLVACVVLLTGGSTLAARTASDNFADAAIDRLGGDPGEVLDSIAEAVVTKLTEDGGTLDEARDEIVDEITGVAATNLEDVDVTSLLNGVRADVVDAGLGKIDEISTDAIVAEVTAALIATAESQIAELDLSKLAKSVLADVAGDVDIEKIVADELAKIDVEALVLKAVQSQMGSSGGSGPLNLWSLFR